MGNKRGRKPRKSIRLMRKRQGKKVHNKQTVVVAATSIPADDHDDIIYPEELPSDPELSTAADDHDDIIYPEELPSDPELSTAADDHDYIISPEKSSSDPELIRGSDTAMRRIVDVNNFFNQLKEVSSHGPLSCGLKAVEMISETRNGLLSQFKLKCKYTCGLYIDPEIPYLGATPDGIVSPDMIVEVKCPTTTYNIGVEKAVENKKFPVFKKNKKGQLELNKEHNYYYQIQGQLHVTRKNKCLIGIWSGENIPVKVEIIKRDDDLWSSKMEEKLKKFYIDCLLPELIDPRYTRKMPIRDPLYITEAIAQKAAKKVHTTKLAAICPNQPTTDSQSQPTTSTAICPDQPTPTTSTAMLTGNKKRPISTVTGSSKTSASKKKGNKMN